jgi:hypothetical protein
MAKAKTVALTEEIFGQGGKLQQWLQAEQELSLLKEREFSLRQEIVSKAGFDPTKMEGTENLDIGNGYKLKVTKKQTYSLIAEPTVKLLNIIGPLRPEIATNFCKWEPKMSKTGYSELLKTIPELQQAVTNAYPNDTPNIAQILAEALTIKPATPTLEIVAPEPKKEESALSNS